MKKYYSQWCSYRHAMPLVNARKILALIENQQLEILGGIKNVRYGNNTKEFTVTYATSTGWKGISAKYLINATGTGYSLGKNESVLIKNLLERQIIRENICGGLDVDFKTSNVISNDSKQLKNIYFVGPLTRGVHFYTNALEMNALYAEKIAELITSKVIK